MGKQLTVECLSVNNGVLFADLPRFLTLGALEGSEGLALPGAAQVAAPWAKKNPQLSRQAVPPVIARHR